MSYVKSLLPQQVVVILGGQEVMIPRASLGQQLLLGQVLDNFEAAPGYAEISEAIRSYFGVLAVDIAGARPVEILAAFTILQQLNGWHWTPAFMDDPTPPQKSKLAYDYEGRNWAWTIHKIASRYGWTDEYILSLYPERVAAYLQEILVSEQLEAEERHSLSELAYRYDGTSKTSRYVPLPRPGWMVDNTPPESIRMLRSSLPYGVLDLSGKEKDYHH